MKKNIISKIIGTKQERDLKLLLPILQKVNSFEPWALSLSDEEFQPTTESFKERIKSGESLDSILPEAFALSREAARRTLGERAYDVQILGGIVLHQGKIMELKTGEGKTLASVAPSFLNALTGNGVHVITVNDYLAERDANWMKPVFNLLGISVGVILSHMDPQMRQSEYAKDITYGTNNEFGFDYLRDNMRWDINLISQKKHAYAVIDEIDSILIDEARTPLIISGPVEEDTSKYNVVNRMVNNLKECEKDPETDDYPIFDPLTGIQPEGDYKLDEKSKRVLFTDQGMNKIEEVLKRNNLISGSLFDEENFEYIHYFTQAMKAHHLFHLDVDYVIQDGSVQIVDEFTGRVLTGRRYSEGLHQAIEAKEKIKVARQSKTLATITFQNYFRMYDKISGMTGTAETEAKEFAQIYNIDVVVVPTNRPVHRVDEDDVIYLNEQQKFEAIGQTVEEVHATGQPILIGTVSVEDSEKLSRHLKKIRVKHEILNAKNHHREALIIAEAGAKGSVTIATNMAGRGTDIKLGGNAESRARVKVGTEADEETFAAALEKEMIQWQKDNEEVKELGGLYVIGSERHESRRIDNQLRGRSGRQGDPGHSQFYVSLDDDLMRLFGGERFKSMMGNFGMDDGEPIYHPMITKALERAQGKVETRNYDIRKHLLEYDDVVNLQRTEVYKERNKALSSESIKEDVIKTGKEIAEVLIEDYKIDSRKNNEAILRLYERLKQNFFYIPEEDGILTDLEPEQIEEKIFDYLEKDLKKKCDLAGSEQINLFLRSEMVRHLDKLWQEHLEALEALREAVSLRSYAQKNPLIEYKNEGAAIFEDMMENMRIEIARKLFRVRIKVDSNRTHKAQNYSAQHKSMSGMGSFNTPQRPKQKANSADKAIQVQRMAPKVGRNDPCPCGSGKKYKKCCGA